MSRRMIPSTLIRPICHRLTIHRPLTSNNQSSSTLIHSILDQVQRGTLSIQDAEQNLLRSIHNKDENNNLLSSFANIDHHRSTRTGFPEAVFGSGKTSLQISEILDSMAQHINRTHTSHSVTELNSSSSTMNNKKQLTRRRHGTVLATRITPKMYQEIQSYSFQHGSIQYHPVAQIITMTASSFLIKENPSQTINSSMDHDHDDETKATIIVACAGTTDIPVAEEAAVTLEATGECHVQRIYDVGVAGLHRILNALPKLRHPNVQCILVVAGMDGALPSVVAGLVSTPVIAIPTSIGYGACFGGVSALLTMLNSCSPGIGVVNIDNGFGGAALAYKCLKTTSTL